MELFKHVSYESYLSAQIEETSGKKERVSVEEQEVKFLSAHLNNPKFGICHGVRTGKEVELFHKHTGANVIGTEIHPDLARDNVIQWDFHEVKQEWIGACDFIYSNALDHSYDPSKCISDWISCLRPNGLCLLRWDESADRPIDEADCVRISFQDMHQLCRSYTTNVITKHIRLQHHWFMLSPQVSLL